MQNESVERNGASYDQPSRLLEMPPTFSNTSTFVNIPDLVKDLVAAADATAPKNAAVEGNPPPSTHPPLSSHDETDSLVRHAADYGEQYINLRKAVTSFMRRYNRFAPVRAEVLLLRSRMEFEWTVCSDQRRFVAESHDSFMREAASLCDAFAAAPVMPHSPTKLLTARAQVVHDHQRQAEHASRTYDTETQLSRLEYSLQQKEYRLAQAAQRIVEILDQLGLPDPGASEPSVAASVVNQESVPALVQYYFDKAGDIGLAREHIIELEVEYREEREKRMFQEDQGILLSMSDEEFEETFKKQLLEAESGLAHALRRADNAKQVCIDSDLDPELYRSRLRPDHDVDSNPDRSISGDGDDPEAPGITPNGPHSPSTLALGNATNATTIHAPYYPDQHLPSILDPVELIIPEPLSLQGLASGHAHGDAAPAPDRIENWIQDVTFDARDVDQFPVDNPDFGDAAMNTPSSRSANMDPGAALDESAGPHIAPARSLSRSKSSEVQFYPLVLEHHPEEGWRVNKFESHNLREERRRASRHDTNGGDLRHDGEVRPSLHTRTSSESQAMVMPWEGSYREAVDSIKGLATPEE